MAEESVAKEALERAMRVAFLAGALRGALGALALPEESTKLMDLLLNAPAGLAKDEIIKLRRGRVLHDDSMPAERDTLRTAVSHLNKKLLALSRFGFSASVKLDAEHRIYSLHLERPGIQERKIPVTFQWKTVGEKTKECEPGIKYSVAIWVPLYGRDVIINYRTELKHWAPPSDLEAYKVFRAERFLSGKHDPHKAKELRWHVRGFTVQGDHQGHGQYAIDLSLQPVAFEDIVATTWSLDEKIPCSDGAINVLAWLGRQPIHLHELTHYVSAANPLMMLVNLETSDDKFIVRWNPHIVHKVAGIQTKGRWEPAVLGFVDAVRDCSRDNLHAPDLSQTFFRKSYERLGLAFPPARVRWLGLSFGQTEGKVGILGHTRVSFTAAEIISASFAKGKWKESRTNEPPQEGELRAKDLTPLGVKSFLGSTPEAVASGAFHALLALSLHEKFPDQVRIEIKS